MIESPNLPNYIRALRNNGEEKFEKLWEMSKVERRHKSIY